jgi:AAA+ superfamily predicted ATPase
MIAQDRINWKQLGTGRISPPDSIPDKKLAERLTKYKNQVAGRYHSVAPQDILKTIPAGEHIVSPKIDGETWFLSAENGEAWLLSPSGKIITDVPVTDEAAKIIGKRHLLLVGELYANGQPSRPRVHDLHAALGGGTEAQIDRLLFAAFDLLGEEYKPSPFTERAQYLMKLLAGGKLCHSVSFEKTSDTQDILEAYQRLVANQGHEGIVVRSTNGQILKIKPEVTIDAVVMGMTCRTNGGIAELLLALQRPDDRFQLLGRINTGFSEAERYDLANRLQPLAVQSSYLAAARSGALFQFLQPQVVVEVKCNDLLAIRANGEPVRRMALDYNPESAGPHCGWQPLRPMPAVSLINAVFRRIRDDKTVGPDSTGMRQITDLVPIKSTGSAQGIQLPRSTVIKREVFSKDMAAGLCVRKLVAWKTNKENADPLYPPYVVFFTDFTPGRLEPLKTEVRVASSLDKINSLAETWLAEKITRGWNRQGMSDTEQRLSPLSLPASCRSDNNFRLDMEMSFARTPSVNFHVAVRRIKALSKAGRLTIENDDKEGKPRHYTLKFKQDALVENVRRIENLYRLIGRWKGAEFQVNNDPLGYHDFQSVINTINDIAACWRMQKRNEHACRTSLALCCKQLQFKPTPGFPGIAQEEPAWYAVGKFDGKVVTIDKDSLLTQLDSRFNEPLVICPLFDHQRVIERINGLPEKLDPAQSNRWATGYFIENNKPAWVFPKNIRRLPFGITLDVHSEQSQKTWDSALHLANIVNNNSQSPLGFIPPVSAQPHCGPASPRNIPINCYADVCGQDEAVEAVRDYAELPLKHTELFQRVGVQPGRGILLHGPPGNGKTLLARAVAGESGAHIEIICGPEILSKWLGESERILRETFQRAASLSPSVIIMDELDAIAGKRSSDNFPYLRQLVSQLLVLMDGMSDRGRILIIATTNCPNFIDPAILRPGRIDRKIFMGPPNRTGRITLLTKLLSHMPTTDDVHPETLADITSGLSGAEIEHITNEAGLLAVKEAIANNAPAETVRICTRHFQHVINNIRVHLNPSNYLSQMAAPV